MYKKVPKFVVRSRARKMTTQRSITCMLLVCFPSPFDFFDKIQSVQVSFFFEGK